MAVWERYKMNPVRSRARIIVIWLDISLSLSIDLKILNPKLSYFEKFKSKLRKNKSKRLK